MNVYPMAPMPLNDHSIQPGNLVAQQAYVDYAPLFDSMHGARWLLSSNPVTITVTDGTMETGASETGTVAAAAAHSAGRGEPWLTAATPVENPYCSCTLTRVRPAGKGGASPGGVSMQKCSATDPKQRWAASNDTAAEIKLAGGTVCLGLYCCGCKSKCCTCDAPEDGAQAAANKCHPADPNPHDVSVDPRSAMGCAIVLFRVYFSADARRASWVISDQPGVGSRARRCDY